MSASAPRAPAATPVLYFAMTDRFADGDPGNDRDVDRAAPGAYHGGDLAGLTGKLDYLADLGVDWLWISPVVDNIDNPVDGAGFPDWGYHGYWARDFERIDEHQGTEQDLARLVAEAHRRGLRVLLDVVLNHPGYGAPLGDDPAWTRSPPRGDCGDDPLTACLFGLPDFRTERPEVAGYLIDAHLGWARRSGADGFRVDAARHVGLDVLERLARAARAQRPGFVLVGEVWGAAPGQPEAAPYLASLDALLDFGFADRALAFATGAEDGAALGRYLAARGDADRWVVFLDSHDTPGFLFRAGGDLEALLLGAALELTVPGMPLVYYGDEVGRAGGEWPANRSDMPWSEAEGARPGVRERYRALIAAHHRLAGPLRVTYAAGPVIGFTRGGEGFVAVNAGRAAARVPLPAAARGRERLGWGARVEAGAVRVPPRSAAVVAR